ncbi:uncharacterized protein LOC128960466 [Oppia nitens]|uniref:uncharacterized protein LOC128960466 n=1 Tax=Oppia nitens TaxID=1686743 RepID=UPI0023DC52CF|nr:uncharacterized protein LOC128960466 [Oppia nitens]
MMIKFLNIFIIFLLFAINLNQILANIEPDITNTTGTYIKTDKSGCRCTQPYEGQLCGKRANRKYIASLGWSYGPVMIGTQCKPETLYYCRPGAAEGELAVIRKQCRVCNAYLDNPDIDRCAK